MDPIDAQMERASAALARCDYFTAERLCSQALDRAFRKGDFERMARIVMPLQESRRQIREAAWDMASRTGAAKLIANSVEMESLIDPDGEDASPEAAGGCFLLQPPLIGLDGKTLFGVFRSLGAPASVLTREPMTKLGKWPIVAVAKNSLRVQVDPPPGVEPMAGVMTRDRVTGEIPLSWFQAASEALGDTALQRLDMTLHPAFQAEDLYEMVEAHPEHEKLHQALAEACSRAAAVGPPPGPRPRPEDDLLSF